MRLLRLLAPLVLLLTMLVPAIGPFAGRPARAASATIEVTPNAILTGVSTFASVSGTGFTPNATVTVWLDNSPNPVGIAQADSSGAFGGVSAAPAVTFLTPAFDTVGQHTISATDPLHLAVHPLYVASLTLSTTNAAVGTQASIAGQGFLASVPLTVQLGGVTVLTSATGANGSFAAQSFSVPPLPAGTQPLVVTSGTGGSAIAVTTTFTVQQAATVTLNPSTLPPGAAFTLTGTNFPSNQSFWIRLDGILLGTPQSSATGALGPVQFTVPANTPSGQHAIGVYDSANHSLASANLTVTPQAAVSISPSSGPPGARVHLTGVGYQPAETVLITINNSVVASTTGGTQGEVDVIFTLPPTLPAGTFTLLVAGQISHASTTTTYIVLPASLALSSTSGPAGIPVTSTGRNFAPREVVTITFADTQVAAAATDSTGAFLTTFTVPSGKTPGAITVTATGTTSHASAGATFTLGAPALTADSTVIQAGNTLKLTGAGFAGGEAVVISAPGSASSTVTADGNGGFASTLTIPATQTPASITITATGQTSHQSAGVTVVVISAPRLALSADSVFTGGSLQVSGGGFLPNELVSISIPGSVLATPTASGLGEFANVAVTLPRTVQPGTVTITATGQQSHRTAATPLVVIARAKGALTLAPSAGIVGSELTITGSGYADRETVTITVDERSLATVVAAPDGAIQATVRVPTTLAGGAHIVSAVGERSRYLANATYTVEANLGVTPSSVTAGAQVQVSGSGFAPQEQISLSINGVEFATARTDPYGGFVHTAALPTAAPPGSVRIAATGVISHRSAADVVEVTTPGKAGSTIWYLAAGRTDAGFNTQIAVLNPNSATVHGTITFFAGTSQVEVRSFVVRPAARYTVDVGQILGGARVAAVVQANAPIAVAQTQERGGEAMTATTGVAAPSRTWYMAEGYTGLTFQEELDLLNPGNQPARVHIVWPLFNGKAPVLHDVVLAPRTRMTIPVNQYVGRASHATVVTADQPVVASRTMLFGTRQQGAHAAAGVTASNTTLYFAEGSTANGFEEYLTILNPSQSATARVSAGFFDRQGRLLATHAVVIEPMHRANVKVNDLVHDAAIATVLRSDVPVVAERSMYFGAPNGDRADGTAVFGQPVPALGWAFATGDTRPGCSEFVLLFNPEATSSTIRATWYTENGQLVERTFTLPGSARQNIDLTLQVPELPRGYHGLILRSTNGQPFFAEQALYGNGMANGSATIGTPMS